MKAFPPLSASDTYKHVRNVGVYPLQSSPVLPDHGVDLNNSNVTLFLPGYSLTKSLLENKRFCLLAEGGRRTTLLHVRIVGTTTENALSTFLTKDGGTKRRISPERL